MAPPKVERRPADEHGEFVHITVGPGQGVAIREVDADGRTTLEHIIGPAAREYADSLGIEITPTVTGRCAPARARSALERWLLTPLARWFGTGDRP